DQVPHRVAVETPEPRQPEQPRRVHDPHGAPQRDRPGVEVQPVQARLGADQRLASGSRTRNARASWLAGVRLKWNSLAIVMSCTSCASGDWLTPETVGVCD